MALVGNVVLLWDEGGIDIYPALLFVSDGAFFFEADEHGLDGFGAPVACSTEQTDDLVGVDGRFIPDDLHHLEFGFGYLGKFFVHSKPPDLTGVIKMIIAFLHFGVNAAVSDRLSLIAVCMIILRGRNNMKMGINKKKLKIRRNTMLIYAVNLIYLLFFLFIYLQDRRRLINGFLFFILLMLSGLSLVMLTDETGNPFLFFLLIIIAMAAALLLFTGVFIILAISFYSAVNLLRKEGRSKANLLSLLVGIGILLWLVLGMVSFKNVEINDVLSVIMLVVNTILLYLLLVFSNFILSSFIYGIYRPVLRQDYIIVLGSGLMSGNRVTPLLAGRIDRALKVYRRQADKKKSPPMLIMSGGQGGDEQIAEGEAMKQYALEQGIPEDHILVEDQSENTYENMLFSRQLIESREADMKHLRILFSTSNYHVFRAGIYARKAGLKAQGIGAKTKFYFWYNALLREYVAILAMHKKTHIVCMLILLVIVGLASLLIHHPDLVTRFI